MQEVLRAWAWIVDRHLFQIFLLKLLLGSLLFVGLLWMIGDFGRDCEKLEEVEHLLEECSSRRLQLEKRQEEEKAESGSGIVEQMKLCERKLERQRVRLEEAKVTMEDTRMEFKLFLFIEILIQQLMKIQLQIQCEHERWRTLVGGHLGKQGCSSAYKHKYKYKYSNV